MRAFLLTTLPLALACVVNVDIDSAAFRCEVDQDCQSGRVCESQRCSEPGSDPTDPDAGDAVVDASTNEPPRISSFSMAGPDLALSGTDASDDDPTLSADQLLIVFNTSRSGISDLFTATREPGGAWSTPTRDEQLSSDASDTTAMLSPDGLTILISSSRVGTVGAVDLYISQRPTRDSLWEEPRQLTGVNTTANDLASWISDDGRSILFHTDASGNYELFEASGDPVTGVYGPPTALAAFNDASATDASARYLYGGLVFTFHSDRAGTDDLYFATRASTAEPFGPIQAFEGINTATGIEQDAWLADDLCTLHYAARPEGSPSKIFTATCDP